MIHSVRRLLGYQKQQCSFAVSMDFILAHGTLGIITTGQATSIRMFIINIIMFVTYVVGQRFRFPG